MNPLVRRMLCPWLTRTSSMLPAWKVKQNQFFKRNLDLMYAYIEEEMTVLSSHGNNVIYLGEKDKWQVEKIPVKTWRPWDESETLFYITKGQILSSFEKPSLMVSFYSLVSKWNWISLKFSLSFNGIRTSSKWGKKDQKYKTVKN